MFYRCAIGSYFTSFIGQPDISAVTSPFAAFVLNNQPSIHFRCSANFCYDPSDARCIDVSEYLIVHDDVLAL